eukprot:jgi/Picre1/29043/NNA_004437.t1
MVVMPIQDGYCSKRQAWIRQNSKGVVLVLIALSMATSSVPKMKSVRDAMKEMKDSLGGASAEMVTNGILMESASVVLTLVTLRMAIASAPNTMFQP